MPMRVKAHIVRVPVVAALVLAWMLASNHCAIASLTGGHPRHSCCEKSRSNKSPESGACAEKCCGALSVPVTVAEAFFAPDLHLVSFLADTPSPAIRMVHCECLTGLSPPGTGLSFFVEYSMGGNRQLAPPVFVA